MKDFIKGVELGFGGFWLCYFTFMFLINTLFWLTTDESEMYYQPFWNIFELM